MCGPVLVLDSEHATAGDLGGVPADGGDGGDDQGKRHYYQSTVAKLYKT